MADENSGGCDEGDVIGENIVTNATEHPIRINKWRVREGFPIAKSQIILFYEAATAEKGEVHKLKANRVGVVKKRFFKEGENVPQGATILELSECVHTTVIKDMCADCGADLRQNENGNTSEASVPMIHSVPDLKVTQKLAQKLGHDDTRRLLQDRKLVLLVDLDQTLIHTTNDNVPNNIKCIYHFQLYGPHSPWYHTRLRPGTPHFLEQMSKYYELHICTFGARNYAHMIAQLLDPDGKFFSHRILSRDECFNATSKTDNLKALFPNGDSMVCIIDDREDVWNMVSNLIQVKPYHFFQHTGDINAPPGLSKHELDGEGVDFKELNTLASEDKEKEEKEKKDSETNEFETEQLGDTKAKESSLEKCEKGRGDNKFCDDETTASEEIENNVDKISKLNNEKDVAENITGKVESSDESKDKPFTQSVAEKENIMEEAKELSNVNNEQLVKNYNTNIENCSDKESIEVTEQLNFGGKNEHKKRDEVEALVLDPSLNDSPKLKLPVEPNQEIEIEDPDDYLLYLEMILKHIHARFYAIYDETQEIPDLKIIVPKIRSEVLRGMNLVFSGLVPTNMKLEQSRVYFIAKSLGAEVSQNISADTTHLVAVTSGTFKVNAAKKNSQIKIVNANWLWSCAERWECVDERLFPLDRRTKSKQRQPPAHCHSPEHVVNYSDKSEISLSSSAQQQNASEPEKFIDTINPLLSFSNDDLADMNEEFNQFFESDSSSDDEHVNIENPPVDKSLRKRKREEKEEERTRDFFTRSIDIVIGTSNKSNLEDPGKSSNEEDDDDDDEMPSTKFRRGENLPSDIDMDTSSNDTENNSDNNPDTEDDGDWNMMGAALEREFLGLED